MTILLFYMKLTVHLVTWNGAKYIPYLFDSLKKQDCTNWKLLIWDNGSEDETVDRMKHELSDAPFEFELIESDKNNGFAGGHNELFATSDSDYFLMINQDMYLEPDCLVKLVAFMDGKKDAGAISPRLMRWNFQAVEDGHLEDSFTDYVDTLGLRVLRSRRVVEYLTGDRWAKDSLSTFVTQIMDLPEVEVFGVSGALPLCRRTAIEQVALCDGTFLDETYHSYKEDVDLAFRLRQAGLRSYAVLNAVAYHDRSAAGPHELTDKAARENKKNQSEWVKYHSYKNHLLTLRKNEYWQNVLVDFPWIAWYELKKGIYFLLHDRAVLRGIAEIFRMRKKTAKNSQYIAEKRKIGWRDIRVWWT